ncbi:MAG: queuosine precursor transporter [Saprospiraceae bacterium]|nr:queuosine precursor transporter [Saprospiraceae bacterium]
MSSRAFTKPNLLFIILGGFFVTNALMAEFVGVKIFSLEKTLGLEPVNWTILGVDGLGLNLTTGVLIWPVVFVLTDVVNEYFGKKGVQILSFMAVGMIIYAFFIVYVAIDLIPADFWPTSHLSVITDEMQKQELAKDVGNYNKAFGLVFGQGLWIIFGSLVAFLIGQFIDVMVFQRIKRWTGERQVWLRATGSTLISQFIDSFVVLFIAFYVGAGWSMVMVLAIGLVNYIYKFVVAIVLTPVIYLAHDIIDRYLGEELAESMKKEALE